MAESTIPTLTLTPNEAPAATAAAVEEAPAVETAPAAVEETKEEEVDSTQVELQKLSEEEQAAVQQFSTTIDIANSEQVMNYGAAAQKNISEFSDAALNTVKTKDLGEVGDMLSDLVVQLKGMKFDQEKEKGLKALFHKSQDHMESLKAQYDVASANIDKIVEQLENHEITLLKDISLMDKMFDKNQEYMKELTMYIIAGKLRAEQLRNVDLVEMQKRAEETGLAEDAQAANDFANLIGRFEKKIYDLELTRMISLQMSPQIRLIQNNDSLMIEKIRTSVNNTIPLWKNQMVLAMTMHHADEAMKSQNEVTEVTNELLKHNAETLHQGTVNIAQASERGIVDLETLQKTNLELISTLEEVKTIQDNGRANRAAAEKELTKIEGELKEKLLSMKG